MVGPFFYIDSKKLNFRGWIFYLDSEHTTAEAYGDYLISGLGHDELFDRQFKDCSPDIEYFQFPRGRVAFNRITQRHVVYMDRCIRHGIDLIVEKYNLTDYDLMEDEHYVCAQCSEDK